MEEDRYLTPSGIADLLKISERTVYRWLDAVELKGTKLGRVWRVKETDLAEFLKKRENTGAKEG